MVLPVSLPLQPTLCRAEHLLFSMLHVFTWKGGRIPPCLSALCPVEGCLSSPLPAGGTGFRGLGEGSSPEVLFHLPREICPNQLLSWKEMPMDFHASFTLSPDPRAGKWTAGRAGSETQATCPRSIPLTWHDLGPSEHSTLRTYNVPDQKSPFLSSSSPTESGRLF